MEIWICMGERAGMGGVIRRGEGGGIFEHVVWWCDTDSDGKREADGWMRCAGETASFTQATIPYHTIISNELDVFFLLLANPILDANS